MKKKNWLFVAIIILIIILAIIGVIIYTKSTKSKKPEDVLKEYVAYLSNKEYEKMYELLDSQSKEKINKENFVTRNKNIYEGIEASNINLEIKKDEIKNDKQIIPYHISMQTIAGKTEYDYQTEITKEDEQYYIKWSSNLIFPNLEETDKIRVTTKNADRGNIYDRNDVLIAGKGIASSVGLVPGKMNKTNDQDIEKISNLLDISKDTINNKLSASYVKDDTFVPIKTIPSDDLELEDKLLKISGIKISNVETRVYPYGEITSHLLGYIQNITKEELEENKDKGYNTNSTIGKTGIEKIYEDKLKGKDGAEIYIIDENGNKKETILKQEVQNGENVKLTIDINLQKKLYEQFKNDNSSHVIMDYKTGEILALVSTPTFNSNDFVLGMSDSKWQQLTNDPNKPLYTRYLETWAPGSSFKPVIGAIGLTNNKIDKDENYGYSGLSWQKDESWGDYKVTTMTNYGENVNLINALIYSDNIYFAKAALNIGRETLEKELKRIGFESDLPFNIKVKNSQYTNSDKIESEIQLADTGYGQGQVLVNPIYMASVYSAFMNSGNMIKPYIEYKEEKNGEIWIENAFSKEASNTIKEALVQAVEIGTAKDAKIDGVTLAGKTGTAEIKNSKEDKNGTEIGWFNAFIADENKDNYLIISMVEDVKQRGGSHYLLPKVKNILNQ